MKKRALVFSALGPMSGCALRARYVAAALGRLGWEVELLQPRLRNLPFALEALLSLPRFAWAAASRPAELMLGIKPYPNCWLALWIGRLRGVSNVVQDVDDLDGLWRRGPAGWLNAAAQAPAFRLLRVFSTHHPAIKAALGARGRWVELGQGVDLGVFHGRQAKAGKTLVFTAHLNVACQLGTLMEWVGPWLSRHLDWKLVIAGGGPKLGAWRKRYEGDQVIFTGPLSPEEAAQRIAGAAACVAAYAPGRGNEHRVPMKIGEYLAMGKPVACNAIEGMDGMKPYLYLSRPDAASFAKVLDRLASKRGDGRQARGKAWVRRNLDWDGVARRFVAALG